MKYFAIFALVVSAVCGFPAASQWTLPQLSEALANPSTDPQLLPFLEHALNQMMAALFAGQSMESIAVYIPSDLVVKPEPAPVEVVVPAPAAVSQWNLAQLSQALQDPNTDALLIPYLEHALNQMMEALFTGTPMETITVVIPDLIVNPELIEQPVLPSPALPSPSPAPAPAPAPAVVPEASASSPLVQIILNINQNAPAAGSPAVIPEAVLQPQPEPVQIVEQPYEPIGIDLPIIEVNPIDNVAIQPPEVNPIDNVVVQPPEVNPIDTIAVEPVEINPIDLIAPLPVLQPIVAGGDVGPIV